MCAKKRKRYIPPCPDPEKYILVNTKEGSYWRRKRGTVKPAHLNAIFAKNVAHSKIVSPAASRIVLKLQPFLEYMTIGRLQARLAGRLIQALNASGEVNFSKMNGLEFQTPAMSKLFREGVSVTKKTDEVMVSFYIRDWSVQRWGTTVTGFYFEAILLYGDALAGNGLRVDNAVSRLYSFEEKKELLHCKLNLPLPQRSTSWMVMLKVSCQEPHGMSSSARHYGMRVVEVG